MDYPRRKVYSDTVGPSMTKQADALECDVNAIAHRWIAHGVPPRPPGEEPRYGDFTGLDDFHSMMNRVQQAEADFAELPADLRDRCKNDPGRFLELVMTPEGRRQLEDQGLKEHQVPAAAPPAAPKDQPTPAPSPGPTPEG